MRFNGLDLNLLSALHVLLEEGGVSRAAHRMNVSQPAMSAALGRLREFFDDELLVPVGRRMVPTARAEGLRPLLTQFLGTAEEMIAASSKFEPAVASRRFRISASDYMVTVLIGPLLERLAACAPGIQLDLFPTGPEQTQGLEKGEIDLVVSPANFLSRAHPSELLLVDEHVVLGWNGNPALARPLDRAAFLALGQVVTRFGGGREKSFAEQQLGEFARLLRIEVTTTSFSSVPRLLVGTQRIAVLQKRLADAFLPTLPIVAQPVPFDLPPLTMMVQYHSARASDPGIAWLVRQMQAALAD
ncbi:LysR family transcriptional regulator [Novosphingobium sp.]|uniref:LysR family transcriptional regulator n=1 Tax=Novosphingobium sp. TaxID=1874826 RepID=UPI0027342A9C|nr:LysR family transcriptional regulator [Novosphingobium sp.]MDP3908637.1 LysR family transcriptional regulator [Novosphingobium sp.]